MKLPSTATRVEENTSGPVNEGILKRTEINGFESAGSRERAEARLRELDEEWDIERVLQTNFAAITLAGVALSLLISRRWLFFSAAAAGFMVEHALKGWCPPVPIFRRLGYRTMGEIAREKYALRAMYGLNGQPTRD